MNLVAFILSFISLSGLKAIPPPGTCEPVQGPTFVVAGETEHRPMCIDQWGAMREQGGSR